MEGNFYLFIYLFLQVEIFEMTTLSRCFLGVVKKLLMSWVHWASFVMFKLTIQRLLNIEQFCHCSIKTKKMQRDCSILLILLKSLLLKR